VICSLTYDISYDIVVGAAFLFGDLPFHNSVKYLVTNGRYINVASATATPVVSVFALLVQYMYLFAHKKFF
jgi:hypothetical protein